ncbi:3-dehydroquinate synthase [Alteribacter natronophilus]|uniref:3-dehydroquinate synthase n=1 Tax=Alteribacter natronophilus TaxID=2583810 RepID=UPI00110E377C|nr:3-dehydroquinate synthase [Alteribacter natronophilus]TMW73595.1 3-dehydroquinate synthase [Alteribacter natronophilus]
MAVMHVQSSERKYPILIEAGARLKTGSLLSSLTEKEYSSCMVITDEHAGKLYLDEVKQSFETEVFVKTIAAGEQSKSVAVYEELLEYAAASGLDRESAIIALGGGVVGDLAGFTAATYMRGIDFIQVPTTLLAHDSSVGGKTGINLGAGKNLAGAFHAPSAVIFDPETFSTLPRREWRSGLAEVIKHGLIRDPALLSFSLSSGSFKITEDPDALCSLLEQSIRVKKDIVEQDEKETGIRAFLNFGHTLGHAIEAEAGYGEWTHGEAVAAGMVFALELSEHVFEKDLGSKDIEASLRSLGYETRMYKNMDRRSLIERMNRDKKSSRGQIRFVLLEHPGKPVLRQVSDSLLLKLL